jgi:hypothetical protein
MLPLVIIIESFPKIPRAWHEEGCGLGELSWWCHYVTFAIYIKNPYLLRKKGEL